jgi:hypothetical protein
MSRSTVVGLVLVAGLTASALGPARAATVEPSQHYTGVVDGNHTHAVVTMVCPGPASPGRTGHPGGGQYVAAILTDGGTGFTGAASTRIVVRFADDPRVAMRIQEYGVAAAIPQGLELPCDGTGVVRFVSRPGSNTAVRDTVAVTFENIAV